MSFEYTFEHEDDKLYFAYSIPYTFTMLSSFINSIEHIQSKNNIDTPIFKKEILGKSLSGV
jgi:hypothetical protein